MRESNTSILDRRTDRDTVTHTSCVDSKNLWKYVCLGHIKALLRLAKCLHELEKYEEAYKADEKVDDGAA